MRRPGLFLLLAAAAPSLVAVTAQSVDYGYPSDSSATQLYFQFGFAVPATDLNAVNQKLEALRNAKPDPIRSLRYQSYLRASQAAVDDARGRLLPQLLADARMRADTLASRAGLKLGSPLSVNDSSYPACAVQTSFAVGFPGGTASSNTGDSGGGLKITNTPYVKFAAN